MTRVGKGRKIRAKEAWPRRALPCQGQGNTCRTQPRALLGPLIYPQHESFGAVETSSPGAAHTAGSGVIATIPLPACGMTWAFWLVAAPGTSIWSMRNTAVPSAGNPSTRTGPTRRGRKPPTPSASCPWPYAWLSRTGCPIKRRAGLCGVIPACLFPSPPAKTGWRLGEKGGAETWTSYLDWSLADFSGDIAVEELSQGPFCVLSLVDNPTCKRLFYQGPAHDPEHKGTHGILSALPDGPATARLGVAGRDHGGLAPVSGALAGGVARRPTTSAHSIFLKS